MKQKLLRTMAVAVGLLAGVSGAWADKATATIKMTYVDKSNPDQSFGEIAAGETAKAGYNKISNGQVGFAYENWGVNYITYLQVDASAIDGTITKATLVAEVSGSTDNKRSTTWGVGYNRSEWSDVLTYNGADVSITTLGETVSTGTKSSKTFESKEFDITSAFTSDEGKIVTILVYETAPAGGYIKNPQVNIEYSPVGQAMATYTVKYMEKGTDTQIKNAVTATAAVGTTYTVSDDDKASFFVEEQKFIYDSDNASQKEITDDGKTVVTIYYRKAETWNYTVNGVDANGNILKELATGSDFEGESITVPYLAYVNVGGTLYGANANGKEYNYTFVLDEADAVKTITYKMSDETDIVYFSEAEDIEGMTPTTSAYADIRCSGSKGAYNASADTVTVTTLTPGHYRLTATVWGNPGENILISYGENTNWEIATKGHIYSESTEITLTKNTNITLPKSGTSSKCLDYIYIRRLADIKSIPATGYATFSSSSNVTVPAGVKVYKARISDDAGSVVLTEVGGDVIPANTGVVLIAEGGQDVTLNVSADAGKADFSGNALIATSVAEYATVPSSGTYYALSTTKAEFGVLKAGLAMSSNKAYIAAPAGEAKTLAISFEGTNGIGEATTATVANGAYYTLQGLKVEKPAKGLYIHNGKKVFINK